MWKNWKTTLAGAAWAVIHVSVNGVGYKQLLLASIIAVFGAIASDHNSPSAKPTMGSNPYFGNNTK